MTENTPETQENISSALNVTDMIHIKEIIDTAIARGAFKGEELTIVGAVYTKLSDFLITVTDMVKESTSSSEESSTEE